MTDNEMNELFAAIVEGNDDLEDTFASVVEDDDEPCPMGDECPSHHRVDFLEVDREDETGHAITYVNEYVVVTDEKPDYLARLMFSTFVPDAEPGPQFDIRVFYVGDEGRLFDLSKLDTEVLKIALRFYEAFDDYETLEDRHNMVVSGIRSGLIDCTKPLDM